MLRRREKEQQQQHIIDTGNNLLKGCTRESVRNYDLKSLGKLDSVAAWNFLRSEILNICSSQDDIQNFPERKEYHWLRC